MNSPSLCLSGNVFFKPSVFLKDSFARYRIFDGQCFFLSALWLCHFTVFGLHCFWCEFYCGFLLSGSFVSYCFQNFLSLAFNNLTVKCLWLTLFVFILFGVHWTSRTWLTFLIKFWTFLSLFLQIFILSLSVLFFKTSHYTYFRMFDVVPQVSEAQSFFSLFSRLDNLYYWSIFKFSNNFLWHLELTL